MNSRREHIRSWAARLASLRPVTAPDVSLFGILAGALHALEQAERLGYRDQRGQSLNVSFFANEFRTTLKRIGKGEPPRQQWLGGFYFLSGIMRLAALIDRLDLPVNETTRGRVVGDVILFKHKQEAHPAARIATRWDDALKVTGATCAALERRVEAGNRRA